MTYLGNYSKELPNPLCPTHNGPDRASTITLAATSAVRTRVTHKQRRSSSVPISFPHAALKQESTHLIACGAPVDTYIYWLATCALRFPSRHYLCPPFPIQTLAPSVSSCMHASSARAASFLYLGIHRLCGMVSHSQQHIFIRYDIAKYET